jgi:quinol monooxygenase YgiN
MITRIVKLTFSPENISAFIAIFNASKNQIRNFEGCKHLALYHDIDKANVYFTYSIWEGPEYLDKYRNSELFKSTWAQTKVLFADKPEAWSIENDYTLM